MNKEKLQKQKKILYIKENNSLDEEESEIPRDVLFMALIQDENASEGKYSVERVHVSISKVENEWMYNKLYLPYPKSEENKTSRGLK